MRKSDQAMAVNDGDERHSSQLEYVDLLLVAQRHCMARIGHAYKRNILRAPINPEGGDRVWANSQDFCPAAGELVISIPQARQLRAAVGSQEATQESQDDWSTPIVREPDKTAMRVGQFKLRRGFAGPHQFRHSSSIRGLSPRSHRTSSRSICRSMYSAGWDDKNTAASGRLSIASGCDAVHQVPV